MLKQDDHKFFKESIDRGSQFYKMALRRFWWVILLYLVGLCGFLVFVAFLIRWVVA